MIELKAAGLVVEREHAVCLHYRGERLATALRLDLLVEGTLVIEVKAVEKLHPVHSAQVITYLKLSGLPAALLVNFNMTTLRAGLKKLMHPDLYKPRAEPVDQPNAHTGTADATGRQLSPDECIGRASYPAVRRDRSEKQDSS